MLMHSKLVRRVAECVVIALCLLLPTRVHAQETVSNEVWLGSQLFTVEDLDNLTIACKLSDDERSAAQEVMRGALVRARTLSVTWMREWEKRNEEARDADDQDDWNKRREIYKKQMDEHLKEVLSIEKGVMNDLRDLLSDEQRNTGWTAFERSRRRLLLRDAEQEGVDVDLVAMVKASKIPEDDVAKFAVTLDQYVTTLDSIIVDSRPLLKIFSQGPMRWYNNYESTEAQQQQFTDAMKRICQLNVRTAKQIESQLSGQLLENFQRQRLRIESKWQWKPMLKLPQVVAVLKIRSLTQEQKDTIKQLALEADRAMLKKALDERHRRDDEILLDKQQEEKDQEQQKKDRRERRQVREKLLADIVGLLSPDQRQAYDSGLENESDLSTAFERKRYGTESWEADRDIWNSHDTANADEE
ncbi:MAG: hypothetical protein U0640_03760 [Phycisphaerales bacterium]